MPPGGGSDARAGASTKSVLDAIEAGWVKSAHDPSDGGLAVCAAECAFHSPERLGCEIDLDGVGPGATRTDARLFGESQSRILITATRENAVLITGTAAERGVPAGVVGKVGGRAIDPVQAARRDGGRRPGRRGRAICG